MSFSKAKLQRFNELATEAPPPGTYDPKFDSLGKGPVINRVERFQDNKYSVSGASAECVASVCDKPLCAERASPVVFRTPQMPRKRINAKTMIMSCPKARVNVANVAKEQRMKYNTKDILAELRVECVNKNKTIQDHEKHIEEIMEEVQKLEVQLEELHKKHLDIEEQHKQDLEIMAKLHQEVLNSYDEKYQTEIESLRVQMLEVTTEKDNEIAVLRNAETELKNRVTEFLTTIRTMKEKADSKQDTMEITVTRLQGEAEVWKEELKKLEEKNDCQISLFKEEKYNLDLQINTLTHERSTLHRKLEKRQAVVLELQAQLSALQCELDEVKGEYEKAMKDSSQHVADLMRKHDEELSKLNANFMREKSDLISAHRKKELHLLAEAKESFSRELEGERKRMKEHADKMVENAEAVTRETLAACRAESQERVKRVILESDAKINTMMREARDAVEDEMRLTADRYSTCLARVETERAFLDEKLAQRDAEINKLSATLEELKTSAETQESFSQSLQVELDKAESELAEKKEELRSLKDHIRGEAAEMVARKKRFEVIMTENQASVAALARRLVQSDAEVERLQHELKRGEDCINEHRNLLTTMRNSSQLVHEQMRTLMTQLDAKRELVDQFKAGTITEVESIKTNFETKLANLKKVTANELTRLQEECEKKSMQNVEIRTQLDEMSGTMCQANGMLVQLEERNDAHLVEITRLEVINAELEIQLKTEVKEMREANDLLKAQLRQRDIALDEANAKIQRLTAKTATLEDSDRHVDNKMHAFEQEKVKWKTIEKAMKEEFEKVQDEVKQLTTCNERLKNDYEEISQKYAELVGHRNHKQRIKHMNQLKEKIYKLEQEVQEKVVLLGQQKRTIEKLKAEHKRAHSKGKENALVVPKSNYSTPTSSPHKPTTPLRNRNE